MLQDQKAQLYKRVTVEKWKVFTVFPGFDQLPNPASHSSFLPGRLMCLTSLGSYEVGWEETEHFQIH